MDSRGVEERLKTASERIANMTLEVVAARMSALEIQNLHNDASDVEQVTKRFFDDYTKVYFDLRRDGTYFGASNPNNLDRGASIK